MTLFDVVAILVCLAAVLSYINTQYLRLPMTIGLMLIALCLSAGLMVADHYGAPVRSHVQHVLERINFSETLLQGLLSFLLFAGALHIELDALLRHKTVIGLLATQGVILSTFLIGGSMYFVFDWLGQPVPLALCLLFGALISPTDPISVLSILKTAKAPPDLSTQIAGESLFNDGIAVVVFVGLFRFATGESPGTLDIAGLLLREAGGGALLGFVSGYATYHLLKRVDDYQVEILLTLALVLGSYALCLKLHVSGPISVVVSGLFIGNHGRAFAMSDKTRENIDKFWELVDEILNAVLFVLIGLEVFLVRLERPLLLAAGAAVLISLLARYVSVGLPLTVLRRRRPMPRGTVRVLTWGGLRGGISVALALTLPAGPHREAILTVTYFVVVASILVQGLTIKRLVGRLMPPPPEEIRVQPGEG